MKYIRWSLLLFLIAAMSYLAFTSYRKVRLINTIEKRLPAFRFYTLEGTAFTPASIPAYATIIIGHFDPDCEHCQYMAQQFNKWRYSLKNTMLVMVTSADSAAASRFVHTYQWEGCRNIKVVLSKSGAFYESFGTGMVPCFFVYTGNGVLKRKISGETKVENLLN